MIQACTFYRSPARDATTSERAREAACLRRRTSGSTERPPDAGVRRTREHGSRDPADRRRNPPACPISGSARGTRWRTDADSDAGMRAAAGRRGARFTQTSHGPVERCPRAPISARLPGEPVSQRRRCSTSSRRRRRIVGGRHAEPGSPARMRKHPCMEIAGGDRRRRAVGCSWRPAAQSGRPDAASAGAAAKSRDTVMAGRPRRRP